MAESRSSGRSAMDVPLNEIKLELAIIKYIEGEYYINSKQLAPRFNTSARSMGIRVKEDDDLPLERTDFESNGAVSYKITLDCCVHQ